jgi:ATP-dependent protease ClpP protease subunit
MEATELFKGKPNNLFSKPLTHLHSFYLYELEHPEEYTDWFETIRHASQNDIIKIHINSPGGVLTSATQLMRCLQETEATVICSVEGECMSAATMIFLQADIVEISDHSMFMFHNYSGGTFGKGGEMMDQLQYERMWSEKMLRTVYEDFLTEEEIDLMLNNKDIWMTGEEVTERMELKAEKLKIKIANDNGETD